MRAHNFSGLFIGLVRYPHMTISRPPVILHLSCIHLYSQPKKSRDWDANWIEALKLPLSLSRLVSVVALCVLNYPLDYDQQWRRRLNQRVVKGLDGAPRRKVNHLAFWLPHMQAKAGTRMRPRSPQRYRLVFLRIIIIGQSILLSWILPFF